jgi:uncharacterized protein
MRIGVMSDTHGGLKAWQEVMAGVFSEADLILHSGDIFYHGVKNPLPEGYDTVGLAHAIAALTTPLLICKGNCDSEVDQLVVDVPLQAPYVLCQFDELRILMHHGHILGDEEVLRLTSRWGGAVCVSGHTHIPRLDQQGKVVFLNPGSPALPKGEGIPTVARIDITTPDKGETVISLFDSRTQRVLKSLTMS